MRRQGWTLLFHDCLIDQLRKLHDPHSAVFDSTQTKVIDGSFVRVMTWYDNEWGFSNRISHTAATLTVA